MNNIGLWSSGIGSAAFIVLTGLLLTAWRGRLLGALLVIASAVSAIWFAVLAYVAYSYHDALSPVAFGGVMLLEIVRFGAWFAFLLHLLSHARAQIGEPDSTARLISVVLSVTCVFLAAIIPFAAIPGVSWFAAETAARVTVFGQLGLSIAGMALVEQLFRNTARDQRWAIKFLFFALIGMFAYDFVLYSDALLFKAIDAELWNGRGLVNAMVVPLIAVSAVRNKHWDLRIFVSRQVVLHSATLVASGLYLLTMAGAGYYIKLYGGSWGEVLQTSFLFAAAIGLVVVFFSESVRARTRVFLIKHFFQNAYEYREEWLKFTNTLSSSEQGGRLRENIVQAIASTVESKGGVLWEQGDGGQLYPTAACEADIDKAGRISVDEPLMEFIGRNGWVVYLDELAGDPEHYSNLVLPPQISAFEAGWLIVPLMQRDDLLGILLVFRSGTQTNLDWEHSDLLKTVGRQAASYIALTRLSEELAEARQFDAFNRLSAYVVHDLKNLVAQLALVVSNAKKHMHNPEFVEDAINTVDNAAGKMNRMLAQLRKGRLEQTTTSVINIGPVLRNVAAARAVDQPVPSLKVENAGLVMNADPERLATVMEHLVQNAQEATPPTGWVKIAAGCDDRRIWIEVSDCGRGMSGSFVRDSLFRPFQTTKGNAGMGIGVYESREFVRNMGGDIDVSSREGQGTTFRLWFPLEQPLE